MESNIDEIDEEPLINYIIDNFGLDGWLRILLEGLKVRKLRTEDF